MCRSGPAADVVPTLKCCSERICLLLPDGRLGYLRTQDAERLQVRAPARMQQQQPAMRAPACALLRMLCLSLQDTNLRPCLACNIFSNKNPWEGAERGGKGFKKGFYQYFFCFFHMAFSPT
jgi:hypothetical protein